MPFLVLALVRAGWSQDDRRWAEARHRMVREEVIEAGITNQRVWAALRETPRHHFVPAKQRHLSYYDMALPIGEGQTISPPFIVAFMTQHLNPQPNHKVLEIGTGSGYQAAVLSPLVADVYSIEIVAPLGRKAAQTLRRLDYDNVHTKIGDGFKGWPEHAPFDSIIVTCSPERIPPALVAQLREGGRMVIPLGERYQQSLYLLKKEKGKMKAETLEATFFVPMTGRAEELRRFKDDRGIPRLVNGDFEKTDDEGQPLGWYYVRQAEVISAGEAVTGENAIRFSNESPGRGAQALQSLGMNGKNVREIEVSLWIKGDDLRPGQSAKQLPRLEMSFFDERRVSLGTKVLGPWHGTISWTKKRTRIKIPVRSRLSVLAVGMFGATGQLSIDQLRITVIDGDVSN